MFCYYSSVFGLFILDFTSNKTTWQLGGTIESGDDIETAMHNIAGARVANLLPKRNQGT